jgi:hypothetical protein
MRRKKIVAGVVVVGLVASAGVAFAAIAGFVQVPDAVTGFANGTGSTSCQTTAITFEVPEPTFDTSVNQYTVSTIDYSGISSTCVTLGTADLVVTVTNGSSTVYATATASNMTLSTGTLTLSQDIEFEDSASASYNFLVRNN